MNQSDPLCLCSVLQGVRSVLPWLPGGLRPVEHGGGVHVGGAAAHRSVQPAAAVPQPGLPRPVPAVPAAGRQHRGRLRQVQEISTTRREEPMHRSEKKNVLLTA